MRTLAAAALAYATTLVATSVVSAAPAASPSASRANAAVPVDPIEHAMIDELARSMDKLELPGFGKPYFLSYLLWDVHPVSVVASFGALVRSDDAPTRTVHVDLRVGDYDFDNSNTQSDREAITPLALEADYDSTRRLLWLVTDRKYKSAVETLERKRAVAKGEHKNPDDAPAFSKEKLVSIRLERPTTPFDRAALEALAKQLSARFRDNADVNSATVSIAAGTWREVFVSSEDVHSVQTGSAIRIDLDCATQAADGMVLADSLHWTAESIDGLPRAADMLAQVDALSRELSALRAAPIVDDYGGPVWFRGVAGAQVIGTLLADSLAGTPGEKGDRPGSHAREGELVGKVGKRILPRGTTVIDDPTATRVGPNASAASGASGASGALIDGGSFDVEGVGVRPVTLVTNGALAGFVMSRIPRKDFAHSNGHASNAGYSSSPRAHVRKLFVSSAKGLADRELRRRAIAAAKDEELDYVLAVDKLDRWSPTIVKRVYADGHEQLVRGATFGAVPLRSLKDILAFGSTPIPYASSADTYGSYDRFAGGAANVVVAPAMLFRDLDVKRPTGPQRAAPIVSRPTVSASPGGS